MNTASRFAVFAVTFAAVYAAVYYFACLINNWPLFSYGPATGEWTLFNHAGIGRPDDVLVRLDRDLGDRRRHCRTGRRAICRAISAAGCGPVWRGLCRCVRSRRSLICLSGYFTH